MIKREKLPQDIKEKLPILTEELKKLPEVNVFFIFGSFAKGKITPLSDIDFAVLLDKKIPRESYLDTELKISGIISCILETEEFDLIILNSAPPKIAYIAYNVIKDGKILFIKDEGPYIDFWEYTVKCYLDFKYYEDEFNRIFLENSIKKAKNG